MKSRWFISATLAALLWIALSWPAAAAEPLRVMTFNIRTLNVLDGRDYWAFRKGQVAKLILRQNPDLLGLQEVKPSQGRDLSALLPDYRWVGTPRDDGEKRGEMCAIFYRPSRLELIEWGTFWLSETPEVPGERAWGAFCRRVVTWAKFRDRSDGKVFFYFNTHFDLTDTSRQHEARLLAAKLPAIAGDAPALLTGDFNCTDDSEPYRIVTALVEDARKIALAPPAGPLGTSRGFKPRSTVGKRIDYIFVRPGLTVESYAALDDTYGKNRRPSDHLPVFALVRLP